GRGNYRAARPIRACMPDGVVGRCGEDVRVQTVGRPPAMRLFGIAFSVGLIAGVLTGWLAWWWTQAARLIGFHAPMRLPTGDAARAMWRLVLRGGWGTPASAFPTTAERAAAPSTL